MKVGFYIGRIYNQEIGGGYTFQESLVSELLKYNFEEEVFIYYSSEKNIYSDTAKVKFININFGYEIKIKKVLFFIKRKKKCKKNLEDIFKRDGIQCIYFVIPAFIKLNKTPYILTVWDLEHKNHTYFPEVSYDKEFHHREDFYKDAVQKAAYTVIGTETGKKQLCNYYNMDEHRIKVNPMPTPNYVYSELADESILEKYNLKNEKYLFYPAQFWAHKNHIRLLKAMKHLKDYGFKMVFTGSNKGNTEYIQQKIQEYSLEKDVINLGFINRNELIALYKNAYALTYASWLGPDNIPPLEAMALGCPVICSNFDGAKDQLGDNALFFERDNEKSLVSAIQLLEDVNTRQRLIENGKVLAKQRHTENYVKKMMNILEEFEVIRECWGDN